MEQGASQDVPDAEQASVEKAETADAESMHEEVARDRRGEKSSCAGTGADHLHNSRRVPSTAHLLPQ